MNFSNFAEGRVKRKKFSARQVSAFMEMVDSANRFILQLKTLFNILYPVSKILTVLVY